jgi:hypothetical protein
VRRGDRGVPGKFPLTPLLSHHQAVFLKSVANRCIKMVTVLWRVWFWPVIFGVATCAYSQDLSKFAVSPADLEKYVETQRNFDWGAVWKSLGIRDQSVFLPPCEEDFPGVAPCSTEVVTVDNPLLEILILEHRESNFQTILRYQSTGRGGWRFSGAYSPNVKYFRPEHRIVHLGTKSFLVITEQGISGSGVSSKIESWFDLTRSAFKPVLAYTSEGSDSPFPSGIGRKVYGFVSAMQAQPVERIDISLTVDFQAETTSGVIPLGNRRDRIVYVRSGTNGFKAVPSLSTARAEEVDRLYANFDTEFSDEEFIKFHYKGLAALLKRPQEAQTLSWLTNFLQRVPDTAEARELRSLLSLNH